MIESGSVVAATANPAKLAEMQEILGLELLARPSEVPDINETAPDLAGNARLKADAILAATGIASLADDTGLEVDALDGAPGVRSARFAGEDASDADNVGLLLSRLDGMRDRAARFHTVICLAVPGAEPLLVDGWCEGEIAEAPRGANGFGYDPVFIPAEGDGRTFAEMTGVEKHTISHRGRALARLAGALAQRGRAG